MSGGTRNNRMRFKRTHGLKLKKEYFMRVAYGKKRSEVREGDRDYQVGDIIQLREWDDSEQMGYEYTGRFVEAEITYISGDFCIEGYVSLSIKMLPNGFIQSAVVVS